MLQEFYNDMYIPTFFAALAELSEKSYRLQRNASGKYNSHAFFFSPAPEISVEGIQGDTICGWISPCCYSPDRSGKTETRRNLPLNLFIGRADALWILEKPDCVSPENDHQSAQRIAHLYRGIPVQTPMGHILTGIRVLPYNEKLASKHETEPDPVGYACSEKERGD
jgi:phosphorylase/glycogen(starch) synthase